MRGVSALQQVNECILMSNHSKQWEVWRSQESVWGVMILLITKLEREQEVMLYYIDSNVLILFFFFLSCFPFNLHEFGTITHGVQYIQATKYTSKQFPWCACSVQAFMHFAGFKWNWKVEAKPLPLFQHLSWNVLQVSIEHIRK